MPWKTSAKGQDAGSQLSVKLPTASGGSVHTGGVLVTFQPGDLGRARLTLEAYVEKKGYFWDCNPHIIGNREAAAFSYEGQERYHTLILRSQVS